jgi:Glyoxalase-like domain
LPQGKAIKNRLHIDLAPPPDGDQAAEVRRLEDRGARRVDVGQGADPAWVVLADPEGNEFCVLTARD